MKEEVTEYYSNCYYLCGCWQWDLKYKNEADSNDYEKFTDVSAVLFLLFSHKLDECSYVGCSILMKNTTSSYALQMSKIVIT